jgi:peptide/nickel transport system substrate-binding protein
VERAREANAVCSTRRFVAAIAAVAVLGVVSTQPAAQAKYGGVLVFGQAVAGPDSLDPTLYHSFGTVEILSTICEGMYTSDKKLNIVPQLATSMPTISPDKLTYTVQLRHGVVFNDGTPFNAQAVVTTYERDINLPGSNQASSLSYIDTVAATGPYTVVFHLSSRFSPLLRVLTYPIMSPTQLQKLGTNFGSDPVCVGPFMYDSQVPGVSVTVIKSPYYYNKYAVYLDKIVFLNLPDTATAAADLKAGDVQVVDSLGAGDIAAVQATTGLAVIHQDTIGYASVTLNLGNKNGVGNLPYATVNTPLAQSPKLRQAFEEAINRNALAKVLAPTAQPGCTIIAQASPYYDPTVRCAPFDPVDARKLVAASGIANPTVHLLVANATTALLIAQFVQAEEQAVGINVVIDATDFPTLLSQSAAGNFDAIIIGSTFTVDPSLALLKYFGTNGTNNKSGFSNPQLDLDLANYVKSTSARSHKVLLHSVEEILANNRPIIVLFHPIDFLAYNTSLAGVQTDRTGALYRIAFAQYT